MKLGIILGTRPEIIKMSPVVRAAQKHGVDFFVLHTGQHYSVELDGQIFQDLELEPPKYNLNIGGHPYHKQVGMMTSGIMKVLEHEHPDVVLVQGDTTSVLAGTLAAKKLNIKVAHHEAGLRSYDLNMLEEINRIVTDHASDYLFTPTVDASRRLIEEERDSHHVYVVGNTIVDALLQNVGIAKNKTTILKHLGLLPNAYVLATAHRAENVDNALVLENIIKSLAIVGETLGIPVILPLHPRTRMKLEEFQIEIPVGILTIMPLGFLEFLQLEQFAKIVLTDSGGIQEECAILRIPCVTMRDNTERPETIACGANIIAGTTPEGILDGVQSMLSRDMTQVVHPFGDGKAGEKIIEILLSYHLP